MFFRYCDVLVSIHAPARGATPYNFCKILILSVSIHAPARGATEAVDDNDEHMKVSIHAPARGATNANQSNAASARMFQSTLPQGERPTARIEQIKKPSFNPRSRKGSDS